MLVEDHGSEPGRVADDVQLHERRLDREIDGARRLRLGLGIRVGAQSGAAIVGVSTRERGEEERQDKQATPEGGAGFICVSS